MTLKKVAKIKNKPMSGKVSKYVSLNEVTYSQTAIKHDLDNDPSDEQLGLIRVLALNVFDTVREWVGGPVKINSAFRGKELNVRIGGSKTSQHCVGLDPNHRSYGAAFDIDDTFGHKTNREMFHYIKENLEFDQLIYEFPDEGDDNNARWLHVSYRPDGNRNNILIAVKRPVLDKDGNPVIKSNGKPKLKTKYLPYVGNENLTS